MSDINALIKELINYGTSNGLISEDDIVYTTNRLLEFFKLSDYNESPIEAESDNQKNRKLQEILDDMLDYAFENGLMENDTITYRDLYDTAIMGLITPPPSVVREKFSGLYKNDPANAKAATDFYYAFSKATNYIRTDRIVKDEKWITSTKYGDLDITINLSKPEKDPRDIAAAGKAKKSGYPACLLCMENEGYAGHLSHPARQNHRIIPIKLEGEDYYLQYSPYVYYNEHCIILNKNHTPMTINRSTMKKLLDFVKMFPHYTAGSNADLPIVGGSILSHDHFQGGGYEFPMVRAPYETEFEIKGFEDIHAGIIRWPLSTIRLQGKDIDRIADLADHILTKWRSYSDEDAFILAETDGEPHNTITPIARIRNAGNENNKLDPSSDVFEIDLVLRNNITTSEHPLGVYHPHAVYHHIKKENIGLIEVMGLAVLPARLKKEMAVLESIIQNGGSLYDEESIASHIEWTRNFLPKYGYNVDEKGYITKTVNKPQKNATETVKSDTSKVETKNIKDTSIDTNFNSEIEKMLHDEIGYVFSGVLEDAGVYKNDDTGRKAFMRFIAAL